MEARAAKFFSAVISLMACCFITSALLRSDWRQTDPGGPGKAFSKSWSYYDGFWEGCNKWTVSGNSFCSGMGDFFARFSFQIIWGRFLLITATATSALGCLFNLIRTLIYKNFKMARKLYLASIVFLIVAAICITGISIWSAVSVYSEFVICAQQQGNGLKVNHGQCLRFGRGMYVAFWASAITILSVLATVFTPSRVENEDFASDQETKAYKYRSGYNKPNELKVYV